MKKYETTIEQLRAAQKSSGATSTRELCSVLRINHATLNRWLKRNGYTSQDISTCFKQGARTKDALKAERVWEQAKAVANDPDIKTVRDLAAAVGIPVGTLFAKFLELGVKASMLHEKFSPNKPREYKRLSDKHLTRSKVIEAIDYCSIKGHRMVHWCDARGISPVTMSRAIRDYDLLSLYNQSRQDLDSARDEAEKRAIKRSKFEYAFMTKPLNRNIFEGMQA